MIAEPNPASTSTSAAQATSDGLSEDELYQLTLYKWRYSLEAFGFEDDEVRDLMFLKWLHVSRRLEP